MNMCKGICKGYEFKRPKVSTHLYLLGAKYCKRCTMWLSLSSDTLYCPCCRIKVRSHPTKSSRTRELKAMQLELNRP